jgi:7-carboxy-7-deazaguanine synthase
MQMIESKFANKVDFQNQRLEQSRVPNALVTLPIVETFHSVQGEGLWTGTSAFFIRLGGCNVGCPWCDTKESWNANRHPQQTVKSLVQAAIATPSVFVVITGGEPLMHDLTSLTAELHQAGLRIHLETSGAYPLSGQFDWITLSPKRFKPVHSSLYSMVNELKIVVTDATDFDRAEDVKANVPTEAIYFLQPEWNTPESYSLITQYVLQHPEWRISLQTHKLMGVR